MQRRVGLFTNSFIIQIENKTILDKKSNLRDVTDKLERTLEFHFPSGSMRRVELEFLAQQVTSPESQEEIHKICDHLISKARL